MDYSRKKVLIRSKVKYSDKYCDMHTRGIYEGRNLNKPILHKFNRKEVSFLNFHDCLKHGKSRIVCKFDVISRKVKHSVEANEVLIPNEKLGTLMKVQHEDKYFFFKYDSKNTLILLNYDFYTDRRQELAHIRSKYDLLQTNNTRMVH